MSEPYLVLEDIVALRAYARAYQSVKEAKTPADLPPGQLVDLVMEIQTELLGERGRGEQR